MQYYWVDLHIHTTLSPCGELEMGAPEIVERARAEGLDIIAIADHNSCDNYPAVAACAADGEKGTNNPVVLPAIEVQTAEDIHVLVVFPDYETAVTYKAWLWERMPPTPNDPDIFGYQVVVDAQNEIVRMEDTLLIQGVGYDVDTVVKRAREVGAIVALAHVDRSAFSYPSVLGPFSPDYPVDAFELSWRLDSEGAEAWRTRYPGRTFIRSSDSHMLEGFGRARCTKMWLEAPTFGEIRKALAGEDGRRISWPWG